MSPTSRSAQAAVEAIDWEIPFYRHDLGQAELDILAEVLRGAILTSGDYTAAFERKFAELLGSEAALGVNSCTGAMHISLLGLDIGAGDEVITTPMSFIATATAILQAGATPVFVDIEPDSGNLDADRIEAAITPRTKAILPVHLYGQMCDMRALSEIAERRGLSLIEDAAHAIEAERDGIRPGMLSQTACFSFYATKNMTCGEGGALVCRDAALAERLRRLRLHGMTKSGHDRQREGYSHWDMTLMGWKYNMSNIEAALLLPQFDRMAENLRRREALAARYEERLRALPGISLMTTRPDTRHARHVFTIRVQGAPRDWLIAELQARRIGCVVNYRPIHLMSYFRDSYGFKAGDYPIAERLGDETLSLPFYPSMPIEQVDAVCEAIEDLMASRS